MKVVTWMLIKWARDFGDPSPMDVCCWIPPVAGVPPRCLCGYGFPPDTPADATTISCEGPFRHVWRDCLEEIADRVRAREDAGREAAARGIGQTGRSSSDDCPCGEGKNPLHSFLKCGERPTSNNSGRSPVEGETVIHEGGFTLAIAEVPACTTCNRIGHLAADCPNEGGSRGNA